MNKEQHIKDGLEGCEHLDKHLDKIVQQSIQYATGKEESLGAIDAEMRNYKKALKRIRKAAKAVS